MEGIVGLIILVISAIGWISNAINEQKAKNNRQPAQPAPNRQRKIHEEIENFLREVNQTQRPAAPPTEQPAPFMKRDEPAPRPRQVASKPQERRSKRGERSRSQKSTRMKQKSQNPLTMEEAVREKRQKQQLQQQILTVTLTDEFINSLSREQVAALQRMTIQPAATKTVSANSTKLKIEQLLATDNIRQSFIINEILQPPLGLRNRG